MCNLSTTTVCTVLQHRKCLFIQAVCPGLPVSKPLHRCHIPEPPNRWLIRGWSVKPTKRAIHVETYFLGYLERLEPYSSCIHRFTRKMHENVSSSPSCCWVGDKHIADFQRRNVTIVQLSVNHDKLLWPPPRFHLCLLPWGEKTHPVNECRFQCQVSHCCKYNSKQASSSSPVVV